MPPGVIFVLLAIMAVELLILILLIWEKYDDRKEARLQKVREQAVILEREWEAAVKREQAAKDDKIFEEVEKFRADAQ